MLAFLGNPKKKHESLKSMPQIPQLPHLCLTGNAWCSCLYPDELISEDIFTSSIKHKNDSTSSIFCPLPSHIFVQSKTLTNTALTHVWKSQ